MKPGSCTTAFYKVLLRVLYRSVGAILRGRDRPMTALSRMAACAPLICMQFIEPFSALFSEKTTSILYRDFFSKCQPLAKLRLPSLESQRLLHLSVVQRCVI
jgi:hypothetical protein